MLLRLAYNATMLLLCGDIELNPGPVNFTICTLNIRSILHLVHSAAISDLIDSHYPDLFCLTETWIKHDTTPAELINCTPSSYSLLSFPRNSSANRHHPTGPFMPLSNSTPQFSSFEASSVTPKLLQAKISVFNIYRPPSSSAYSVSDNTFLHDFNDFLSFAATNPREFIITGDFNKHLDHLTSQFLSLLSSFNLTQHVIFPTHNRNHTLDLVILSSDTSLTPSVSTTLCSPSDHFPVFTELSVNRTPLPPPTSHSFRCLHYLDTDSFFSDLKTSQLITNPPDSLDSLLTAYIQ